MKEQKNSPQLKKAKKGKKKLNIPKVELRKPKRNIKIAFGKVIELDSNGNEIKQEEPQPKQKKTVVEEEVPVKKGPTAAELRRLRREYLRAQRWRREHLWRSRKWLVPVTIEKLHVWTEERFTKSLEIFDRIDINNFREERRPPKLPEIKFIEEEYIDGKAEMEEIENVLNKYILAKGDRLAHNDVVLRNVEEDARILEEKATAFDGSIECFDKQSNYLITQENRVVSAKKKFGHYFEVTNDILVNKVKDKPSETNATTEESVLKGRNIKNKNSTKNAKSIDLSTKSVQSKIKKTPVKANKTVSKTAKKPAIKSKIPKSQKKTVKADIALEDSNKPVKHVRKGTENLKSEYQSVKNEFYDIQNANIEKEAPFLEEMLSLGKYLPPWEVIQIVKEEAENSNLDEFERTDFISNCTEQVLVSCSTEQMSLHRQDAYADIIDMPLTADDSIIEDMEQSLKDPLLNYQFKIPSEYDIDKMDKCKTKCKTKANMAKKVVSQYKNEIVDVTSYTEVKTRLFPDGYRIAFHPNGDIQLFESDRNVYFDSNSSITTVKSKVDGSTATIMKNGHFSKIHSNKMKFIRFPKGHFKVVRDSRDELVKTVEGKYMKKSKFGKISFL